MDKLDKLDELIDMLAALKPRDWDRRGYAKWEVAVGGTDIVLLNTHLSADNLGLYVNHRVLELTPDQRGRLWAFCGKGNKEQRDAILEKALIDLRTLVR